MRKWTSIFLIVSAVLLLVSFHFYSGLRTFGETVGFNLAATIRGLVFGLVLPLVFIVLPVVSIIQWRGWGRQDIRRVMLVCCVSLLIGCVVSEIQLLRDEAAFAREVAGATTIQSRGRAWPNENSDLVFVPGQGIHDSG